MEFKLTQGPWKQLFAGNFQEHEVEIFSNPESMILVIIHEKKAGKIVGSVVEVYRIFHAEGNVDAFVETLPKEVIVLTKHTAEQTLKFLVLGSSPNYVEYKEEKFAEELNRLVKNLKNSSLMIRDISKAYDLALEEIAESKDAVRQAFFSQPLLVPLLSTSAQTLQQPEIEGIIGGVILGTTREGKLVAEPLVLFNKTIVSGGTEGERLHVIHILAEGSLISNIATVMVDWSGAFSGMSTRSSDSSELRKYKVEIEPIGFPVKEFSVPESVKVNLGTIEAKGLMEVFGAGDNAATRTLIKMLSENKFNSLREVEDKVREVKVGGDFNDFQKIKTIRIVRLIAARYGELFNGPNDIKEISKRWVKGIGRAGIILLKDEDSKAALMVLQSLIKELLNYYMEQGTSKELKCIFFLPSAQKIIPVDMENVLMREIAKDLAELPKYGVGVVLGSERETDLNKNILGIAEAKLSIIRGNDVGVQLKDRKNYRVLIRPGLSTCTEK